MDSEFGTEEKVQERKWAAVVRVRWSMAFDFVEDHLILFICYTSLLLCRHIGECTQAAGRFVVFVRCPSFQLVNRRHALWFRAVDGKI